MTRVLGRVWSYSRSAAGQQRNNPATLTTTFLPRTFPCTMPHITTSIPTATANTTLTSAFDAPSPTTPSNSGYNNTLSSPPTSISDPTAPPGTANASSTYICIECTYPVTSLYTPYSNADDRALGRGVRLTQCPRCKGFADKYVEHDFVVLFIDLVLIKPQVRGYPLDSSIG